MGSGRPQGEMAGDRLDHCGLLEERNDGHGAGAVWTHQPIDFVELPDAARPRALAGRWNDLVEFFEC